MPNETMPSRTSESVKNRRPQTFARIAMVLGIVAFIVHYLPLSDTLQSQVAAAALIVMSGLSFLTWIPRQRIDLTCSMIIAGGIALPVLASSALLIVNWYTPDRAAMGTGLFALASLFSSVKMEKMR